MLRLLELFLEGFTIGAVGRRHRFVKLFGLRFQRLADVRRVARGQRSTRLFCPAQEFSLLQDSAVQLSNFRFELECILPAVPVRNNRYECRQDCCRAEAKYSQNQPKAPFGIRAPGQGFYGYLREMFSMQRIVQFCFEFELWLSLTKLCPDFRKEFQRFKGKGGDIVSTQVQGPGTFQRATVNNHHNPKSWQGRTCLDLTDHSAAAEVRWRCFCDQDFRGESENLVNG